MAAQVWTLVLAAGAGRRLASLTGVVLQDPDALVVLTPADHGVANLRAFREGLDVAIEHAHKTEDVVLCGVEADEPVEDYGWILPAGARGSSGLRAVDTFLEKPARPVAEGLMRAGGAWNTVAARARVLLGLFDEHLPAVARVFAEARRLASAERSGFLTDAYQTLAATDFSRHLIEQTRNLATYVWPASVGWSDLGTPDRLLRWTTDTPGPGRASAHAAA